MGAKLVLMKNLLFSLFALLLISCGETPAKEQDDMAPKTSEKDAEAVNLLLEDWHAAAANANFDAYFSKMAEPSIFIGTDPTENWEKQDFKEWAKPYFDRGKAWSFSTLERNVFFSEEGELAWFDELLDTQMGICRGSGVLTKEDNEWKIKHYVLSLAIPNEQVPAVTQLKQKFDNSLISQLKSE